ncbi:MAG: molybdate ABC transporter permease subunit [Candidatus Hydrogenedentes bacterium]|nr:molybdate ABC transporter permease subunit [Candidatus Hydrogenedentota bacterium]
MPDAQAFDWTPVLLTLQLAAVSVVVLLIMGTPLAWWLARTRNRARVVVEALVAMPLVLPPTVLGFYLLFLLGPHGPVGGLWESWGGPRLVFSFPGLVIGSVLYSLPFVVQPIQNAFMAMGERPLEVAATLGANAWDRFFSIAFPMARRGVLTAATLGFAHTVGEFGVVLMIGGNIPGSTRVVSIAIYDSVEALNYPQAHILSAGMFVFSFAVFLLVYAINRRADTVSR